MTPPYRLRGERVLVTGANGSLGSALIGALQELPNLQLISSDKHNMDVADVAQVQRGFARWTPSFVYHLAGAKSAPDGEESPEEALFVNGVGTANVVGACRESGAKLVTASTCKAANPETAYGASKLLAERLTLNADGWVARFYNVRETCGNVFEIWRGLKNSEPVPVTPCYRYFIGLREAVDLLLAIPSFPPGRYTVDPGRAVSISSLAAREYPGRQQRPVPPRRGDRLAELRCGTAERVVSAGAYNVERIESWHDA